MFNHWSCIWYNGTKPSKALSFIGIGQRRCVLQSIHLFLCDIVYRLSVAVAPQVPRRSAVVAVRIPRRKRHALRTGIHIGNIRNGVCRINAVRRLIRERCRSGKRSSVRLSVLEYGPVGNRDLRWKVGIRHRAIREGRKRRRRRCRLAQRRRSWRPWWVHEDRDSVYTCFVVSPPPWTVRRDCRCVRR